MKMIELSVNELTKYYGANKIFESISFDVKTGERVGLIGSNGCGKTTIFKILMGVEDYASGEVAFRKGMSVGYLDQMPSYDDQIKAIDVMEMAFEEIFIIRGKMRLLEREFINLDEEALERSLKQYGLLTEQFETLDGYNIETSINKICEGLKIPDRMVQMPFENLSGGEKTRVILAKILLESPDLLLLDEPSNHLDMESIEWLEEYLKLYQGTVLIVSHDRYFLDRVVTRIVEMEFSKANVYYGNYSYYLIEKERRFLIEMKFYMNELKKIKRMEDQIKRYRIWGVMRDSEKMFKKAKELEKRLEKMPKVDRPVIEKKKISLKNSAVDRSGKRVLEVEGLKKSYDSKALFEGLEIDVFYQDSVCLVGANGSGKTTLLRILLEEEVADKGTVKWGANVKIGYLPQNVSFEDESKTLQDYISEKYTMPIGKARDLLAKVLFVQEDVYKRIESLSGGEKSRLKLCSLLYEEVNCMVLDEPTNHLDIESREVLEELLLEYEGTILFVSHDRYFITKIATKMCELEERGLTCYNGTYDFYREEKLKLKNLEEQAPKIQQEKIRPEVDLDKERLKESKKVEKAMLATEEAILGAEEELTALNLQMADETLTYEVLQDLYERKNHVEEQIKTLFDDLEKLDMEKGNSM